MNGNSTKKYNAEFIEREFIKSVLMQVDIIPEVTQIVNLDDFSVELYKSFYKAILELYSTDTKITKVSIFKTMEAQGSSYKPEDLSIFYEEAPLEHPIDLAQQVRMFSVERSFGSITSKAVKTIKKGGDTLTEMVRAKEEIESLSERLVEDSSETYEESIDNAFETFLSDDSEIINAIPTPYPTLNNFLGGGLKPQKLYTVCARTGIGKTVLATQCAAEACAKGKSVLYFSLEMPKEELYQRIAACYGNICLRHMEPGAYRTNDVRQRIEDTKLAMKSWHLDVRDESDITMEHINAICQQKAQSSIGVDLIIIDYLGLISTKGMRKSNRQEIVAEISRGCKLLSRKVGCSVMVLAQLNRESKDDAEDRIPTKADIKESGAIASDSDVVLVIHRKNNDDSTDPKGLIILDKHRGGPSDKKIQVRCVLEKNIFQDIKGSVEEESSENTNNDTTSEWANPNDVVESDFSDNFDDDFESDDLSDWFGDDND
jgi:dnaB-like helicase N terminal domain